MKKLVGQFFSPIWKVKLFLYPTKLINVLIVAIAIRPSHYMFSKNFNNSTSRTVVFNTATLDILQVSNLFLAVWLSLHVSLPCGIAIFKDLIRRFIRDKW